LPSSAFLFEGDDPISDSILASSIVKEVTEEKKKLENLVAV